MRNSFDKFPVQDENKPYLSDVELVSLLKKSNKLSDDEKRKLSGMVRDLEEVDPKKMERIKKILHSSQS